MGSCAGIRENTAFHNDGLVTLLDFGNSGLLEFFRNYLVLFENFISPSKEIRKVNELLNKPLV